MTTAEQWVAIIGGALVIGASIWRLATSIFRLAKRWDRLLDEHQVVLDTLQIHGKAIETLQRRAERRARNSGQNLSR